MLIADLVLEGGGVRGIALVGAVAALEEAGYAFHRVAGTSSGALVGALVAAGLPSDRLHGFVADLDFSRFLDPTAGKRVPIPLLNDLISEVAEHGLYRGDALHEFVAAELASAGVVTFKDLRLDDPGMDPNVPPDRRYRLVVVASDVTRQRMIRVPWIVQREYGIDPDTMKVADAVRMSTAIPYYFKPFTVRSTLTGQDSYLVDGGLNSGFPVDVFDRTDGKPARWPTFYIGLQPVLAPTDRAAQPRGPFSYARALVLTGIDGRDNADLDSAAMAGRTVVIDTSYVNPVDFAIGREQREELYQRGHDVMERFLGTFRFPR
jgi:NTE family protein